MNHRYYKKSKKEQKNFQLKLGAVAFLANLLVLFISIISGLYFLIFLSIAITLSVIAPFYDTPSLKESGSLIYYSPLFLAEKEKDGIVKVHGGSLFDYVFVIDTNMNGRQRTNFIIKNYLDGLLNLIETHNCINTDQLKITGTTYILNEKTANKIGFKKVPTDFIQKVILVYNFVNITISNSIAKAKFTFPNLTEISSYEADLKDLISNKDYIKDLSLRLRGIDSKLSKPQKSIIN